MKKFLVFYHYANQVMVSREMLPEEWTYEMCVKHIEAVHKDIVSIQPYDVFIISL